MDPQAQFIPTQPLQVMYPLNKSTLLKLWSADNSKKTSILLPLQNNQSLQKKPPLQLLMVKEQFILSQAHHMLSQTSMQLPPLQLLMESQLITNTPWLLMIFLKQTHILTLWPSMESKLSKPTQQLKLLFLKSTPLPLQEEEPTLLQQMKFQLPLNTQELTITAKVIQQLLLTLPLMMFLNLNTYHQQLLFQYSKPSPNQTQLMVFKISILTLRLSMNLLQCQQIESRNEMII